MKHYYRVSVPATLFFTVAVEEENTGNWQARAIEAAEELMQGDGLDCLPQLTSQIAEDMRAHVNDAEVAAEDFWTEEDEIRSGTSSEATQERLS